MSCTVCDLLAGVFACFTIVDKSKQK